MNTSTRLVIVGSNPSPKRDLQCPPQWLLHAQGRATLSLQVTYDIYGKPHVLNKKAA
jgi:hypothetical protein